VSLRANPAGLAEHPKVVRDRGLVDIAARREVAGANRPLRTQLAKDRESSRVGGGVEKTDLGVSHRQQLCGATSCA